jgi:thiol-disulfide isomerase/thioredoxin
VKKIKAKWPKAAPKHDYPAARQGESHATNASTRKYWQDRSEAGCRSVAGAARRHGQDRSEAGKAQRRGRRVAACLLYFSYAASVMAGSTTPAIGSIAPDFKAHNLVTHESTPLSSQRGKVVILTFWASWCAPCRREIPILEKAQQVIGKDRLTVFAVSYKDTQAANAIYKLARAWQINVIEDRSDWIANHYAITSIPHLFIIGRDGKILANHLGYGDRSLEELVDDINHALAEPTPVEQDVSPTPAN